MTYTAIANGKEIEYGLYIENSRFTDEEWLVLHRVMVRENFPEIYEARKDDEEFITVLGTFIALEERYEALLEALPQDQYSHAGAHPKWVADAVEENTLSKETTVEDVATFLGQCETLEDLKEALTDYFELEDLK